MENIDLSECPDLRNVNVSNNRLYSLELDNSLSLRHLACSYNRLESLNLRANTSLQTVECRYNMRLSGAAIDVLFGTLRRISENSSSYGIATVDVSNCLGSLDCDPNIAIDRGWIVITQR